MLNSTSSVKLEMGDVIIHCGHVDENTPKTSVWIKPGDNKISVSSDAGSKVLVAKWMAVCHPCSGLAQSPEELLEKAICTRYKIYKGVELVNTAAEAQPPIDRISFNVIFPLPFEKMTTKLSTEEVAPLGRGERFIHCGHALKDRSWFELSNPIAVTMPFIHRISLVRLVAVCKYCLFRTEGGLAGIGIKGDGEIGGTTTFKFPTPKVNIQNLLPSAVTFSINKGERFIACGHSRVTGYWYNLTFERLEFDGEITTPNWVHLCEACVDKYKGNLFLLDYAAEGVCRTRIPVVDLN